MNEFYFFVNRHVIVVVKLELRELNYGISVGVRSREKILIREPGRIIQDWNNLTGVFTLP